MTYKTKGYHRSSLTIGLDFITIETPMLHVKIFNNQIVMFSYSIGIWSGDIEVLAKGSEFKILNFRRRDANAIKKHLTKIKSKNKHYLNPTSFVNHPPAQPKKLKIAGVKVK